MLDWNAGRRDAVVRISVVEVASEEVVALVEDLVLVERVFRELDVAFEEFSLAGRLHVVGDELATAAAVLPVVLDELADAQITVLFAHALLAVFVSLAFVVQSILKLLIQIC